MRLSESATSLFTKFFEDCKRCEGFEPFEIQVYVRRGSKILTSILMVDGITIGRHIFVSPKLVSRDANDLLRISKTLIAHELVHVFQYRRLGFLKFLYVYVNDFWKIFRKKKKWNLKTWFDSYLEIPHEIEARDVASEFSVWLSQNKND